MTLQELMQRAGMWRGCELPPLATHPTGFAGLDGPAVIRSLRLAISHDGDQVDCVSNPVRSSDFDGGADFFLCDHQAPTLTISANESEIIMTDKNRQSFNAMECAIVQSRAAEAPHKVIVIDLLRGQGHIECRTVQILPG